MLDRVALVDDEKPVDVLDHILDLIVLVAGHDREAIPLASDTFVLGKGHQDTFVASVGFPALALKLELLLGAGPLGALVESGNPFVDRANQAFVPCLALEPLLHRRHPTPAAARARTMGQRHLGAVRGQC